MPRPGRTACGWAACGPGQRRWSVSPGRLRHWVPETVPSISSLPSAVGIRCSSRTISASSPARNSTLWAPDNPVYTQISWGTAVLNTKAMELGGITNDMPDPGPETGGRIWRDADGNVTGKFTGSIFLKWQLRPLFPEVTGETAVAGLKAEIADYLKLGVTTSMTYNGPEFSGGGPGIHSRAPGGYRRTGHAHLLSAALRPQRERVDAGGGPGNRRRSWNPQAVFRDRKCTRCSISANTSTCPCPTLTAWATGPIPRT